jgi:hypothetical protein
MECLNQISIQWSLTQQGTNKANSALVEYLSKQVHSQEISHELEYSNKQLDSVIFGLHDVSSAVSMAWNKMGG